MPKGIYVRTSKIQGFQKDHKPTNAFQKGHKINLGKKHSDATKLKMSLLHLDNKNGLGYRHTKEAKIKIGEASKGNTHNQGKRYPKEINIKKGRKGILNSRWKGGRVTSKDGYILIKNTDHPYKGKNGYVLEHRLVMEEFLGRYLLPEEVIHHEGEKDDNRIEMLMLFENDSKHKIYHDEQKKISKVS